MKNERHERQIKVDVNYFSSIHAFLLLPRAEVLQDWLLPLIFWRAECSWEFSKYQNYKISLWETFQTLVLGLCGHPHSLGRAKSWSACVQSNSQSKGLRMSAGLWMPKGIYRSRGFYAIILAVVDNFQLNALLVRAGKTSWNRIQNSLDSTHKSNTSVTSRVCKKEKTLIET